MVLKLRLMKTSLPDLPQMRSDVNLGCSRCAQDQGYVLTLLRLHRRSLLKAAT